MAGTKEIILSGIRPTGRLHYGNYFGAIRNFIDLQSQDTICYYFIADYHALTTITEREDFYQQTIEMLRTYVACGLDPAKSVIYRQSDLPCTAELALLLGMITNIGFLARGTTYKDKMGKLEEGPGGVDGNPLSYGLLGYPVLMAADILIVQANVVPVGRDQKQHVEVTRDLAIKFNLAFGDTFTIPEPQIADAVAVVPGLDGQKMSKSYGNTIEIFGDPKATRKRIMSIVTDSKTLEEPKDPDTCNVFRLYKLFATEAQQADLAARYRAGGMGYGTAKKELADLLETFFAPMRAKRAELAANPRYVEDVLQAGAAKARAVARETLQRARRAVGLE